MKIWHKFWGVILGFYRRHPRQTRCTSVRSSARTQSSSFTSCRLQEWPPRHHNTGELAHLPVIVLAFFTTWPSRSAAPPLVARPGCTQAMHALVLLLFATCTHTTHAYCALHAQMHLLLHSRSPGRARVHQRRCDCSYFVSKPEGVFCL